MIVLMIGIAYQGTWIGIGGSSLRPSAEGVFNRGGALVMELRARFRQVEDYFKNGVGNPRDRVTNSCRVIPQSLD